MPDNRQRVIIWIGILLVLAAGAYPPWTHGKNSLDWLFAKTYGPAHVDFTRLLIEWIMIAIVTAGVACAAPIELRRHNNNSSKVPPRARDTSDS
jgi:hypothetical protein